MFFCTLCLCVFFPPLHLKEIVKAPCVSCACQVSSGKTVQPLVCSHADNKAVYSKLDAQFQVYRMKKLQIIDTPEQWPLVFFAFPSYDSSNLTEKKKNMETLCMYTRVAGDS